MKIWLYKAYIDQEVKKWSMQLVGLFAVIMIVSLAISYLLFTRAITKPITRVVRFVKKVAEGDLAETSTDDNMTLDSGRKDEIGTMMNAVMEMI